MRAASPGKALDLDDGARVAATIGLPRLRAHVDNERMRLDLPVAASPGRREHEDALPDGGLGEITAQLRDETEIRGLLADQPGLACERAQAWVLRLQHQRRPRALLQANRLLVAALGAAGRTDDAKQTLARIAAQCAELGMIRYLHRAGCDKESKASVELAIAKSIANGHSQVTAVWKFRLSGSAAWS